MNVKVASETLTVPVGPELIVGAGGPPAANAIVKTKNAPATRQSAVSVATTMVASPPLRSRRSA